MINKLQQFLYKNASIAFTITGAMLFFIHAYLVGNLEGNTQYRLWLFIFGAIQIGGGFIFGLYVQKLYTVANTDFLTGLNNVNVFYRELDKHYENVLNNGHSLSLIIIDLDKFKSVNDNYGHLVGDKVLKGAAEILKLNIREEDILARFGGEEFAIILPNTSLLQAMEIAEKLRYAFQTNHFSEVEQRITISLGVTTYTEGMKKLELIKVADDAMYRAKAKQNTVVSIVK